VARYNAQFAVTPRNGEDAHRRWQDGAEVLDAALARHDDRRLSKALTFSAGGAVHCIKTRDGGIALRGAQVTVRHYLDGRMDVVFKDRVLPYTTVRQLPAAAAVEDDKTLDTRVDALLARQRQEPRHRGCGRLEL
jgi:hypothetical protein